MTHTIRLTPKEVRDAVREYLAARGYDCDCIPGCGATVNFEFNAVHPDMPGASNEPAGLRECVVEGVRMARDSDDEEELNR